MTTSALREPAASDLAEQRSWQSPATLASHKHLGGALQIRAQRRIAARAVVLPRHVTLNTVKVGSLQARLTHPCSSSGTAC